MILINIFVWVLNILYCPIKLFRTKRKVFFVSRQHSKPSKEYMLLINCLSEIDPELKVAIHTRILKKSVRSVISNFFGLFVQMYHIASSKVVITDGYCIPISVLRHKKSLTVFQLWHAIGVIKKFGLQALTHQSIRAKEIAKRMKMHNNYTFAICASKDTAAVYQRTFGMKGSQMLTLGTPMMDYVYEQRSEDMLQLRSKIVENDKPVIVYLPTLRKKQGALYASLLDSFDFDSFNLVMKLHPHDKDAITDERVIQTKGINAEDLVGLADYVITDYSGVAYSALLKKKKVLFYIPDIDTYKETQGLCVDIENLYPKYCFRQVSELMNVIKNEAYDINYYNSFIGSYLVNYDGKATSRIVVKILDCI